MYMFLVATPIIALIVVSLLSLFALSAFLLLVKSPRFAVATIFLGFFIFIIMCCAFLALSFSQRSHSMVNTVLSREAEHATASKQLSQREVSIVTTSPSPIIGGGSCWLPEVEEQFKADVYPSSRAAARALGFEAVDRLSQVTSDDTPPSIIQVSGSNLNIPGLSQIMADFAAVLRDQLESTDVTVHLVEPSNPIEESEPKGVTIVLDLPAWPPKPTPSDTRHGWKSGYTGPLRATVSGSAGHVELDARFVSKPWVDQYAEFIARTPGETWFQARSCEFASSEQEARQQALMSAAQQLAQNISVDGANSEQIQEQVVASLLREMQNGKYVVDRFAQQLSRPYGDVWREAVLVDTSSRSYATAQAASFQRLHHATRISRVAAMVMLLLFASMMYAILDTLTKGYYARAIAFGLFAVVLVGGGLLFVA